MKSYQQKKKNSEYSFWGGFETNIMLSIHAKKLVLDIRHCIESPRRVNKNISLCSTQEHQKSWDLSEL